MKKIFGEFKAFIARGNVLDLAVGVITVSYTHLDVYKRQVSRRSCIFPV